MSPFKRLSHSRRVRVALRRAGARRQSDGAVMFIVVVTLGLLAVMGAYGLSSTAADIKSAGHMREAVQAQKAGEHALMMTAETFNPAAAKILVESMSGPGRTLNCKTAVGLGGVPANVTPFPAGTLIPASGACLRLTEAEMVVVARSLNVTNPWPAGSVPGLCVDPAACGFGTESFGPVASKPFVQVEVSNPVDVPPPPGSGYDPATQRFTQVTVTVFVDVRKTGATAADAVVAGRGRLTVGPITGSAPALTAPP